jgi:hypothetical protein
VNNSDFVLPNGLQMEGYIDLVGGQTPTNGQLLIGDSTNNRYSIGYLTSENCLSVTNLAGSIVITSNATNENTPNTIVSRDANGNFIAGTITAALQGNAATATKFFTPQTINGIAFDGSQPITLTTSVIPEGTNLYFTNARASAAAPVQTVFGRVGNVVLEASDVDTALGYDPINPDQIDVPNGIAPLDSNGYVPMANMPPAVVGGFNYQGTWNAATNSPAIVSGQGTKGWLYAVSVAGTTVIDGNSQWNVGDQIVFSGTVWQKIDGLSNEVVSVFGRNGEVVLEASDMITAWGTQPVNTFLAAPSNTAGAVAFRTLASSDLPLATTSAPGAVQIGAGLNINSGILAANVLTVAGRTGSVILTIADIQGGAPIASPAFTGTPTAPTPTAGNNSTQIATTAFVNTIFAAPEPIGNTTPNSATFTTLTTTGLATLNSMVTSSATITGGSINGTPIGGTTPSTGAFTSVTASNITVSNPISYSTQTLTAASSLVSAEIVMLNSGVSTVIMPSTNGTKVTLINNTGSSVTVEPPSGWGLNFVTNGTMTLVSQAVVSFVSMANGWFAVNGTYGA